MPMGLHASPASDLVFLISHEALCSSEVVQMVSFCDVLFLVVRSTARGRFLYSSPLIVVMILSAGGWMRSDLAHFTASRSSLVPSVGIQPWAPRPACPVTSPGWAVPGVLAVV